MRKCLARILGGALALVALVFLATVMINAFDEPLLPEVQNLIEKQTLPTDRQKKAYFFVLGLFAGEKLDPEKKGAELWEHRDEPHFWEKLGKTSPWPRESVNCGPHNLCTVAVLNEKPELSKVLAENHQALLNYEHLIQYEEGTSLFKGNEENFVSRIHGFPYSMHRLFLLQLADWLRLGQRERVWKDLISSNRFMQSFYQGSLLIEGSIAAVNVNENARFLQSELLRDPQLRVPRELVDSFQAIDARAFVLDALQEEIKVVSRVARSAKWSYFELSSVGKEEEKPFLLMDFIPIRFFFKPNETLNHYYLRTIQLIDAPCDDVSKCSSASVQEKFLWPWDYLVNPFGRSLIAVISFLPQQQRKKLENWTADLLRMKSEFEKSVQKAR